MPRCTVGVGKKNLKYLPLFGQIYWLAGNIMAGVPIIAICASSYPNYIDLNKWRA